MSANLSPEYKAAEAAFRQARDPSERLDRLREMLRTIPKHKGTDHLQADIKSRIKQLTEELAGPRKGAARSGPVTVIHPEGAGQVALLGPPNSGKSSLHRRLTHSGAPVGPYPFTTRYPLPGMLSWEDILFQLVDLPPVSAEHLPAWFYNALQPAGAALLAVDLGDPACVELVQELHRVLAGRHVFLAGGGGPAATPADPFALSLPVLMLVTKADRLAVPEGELAVFLELTGLSYPARIVSCESGRGLDAIGPWLFRTLDLVRVYTKTPGREADRGRPFTVRRGQTVHDVARLIHKEIAGSFRFARVWGPRHFDGQQVGRDHQVEDGDLLEIHV